MYDANLPARKLKKDSAPIRVTCVKTYAMSADILIVS